MKKSNLLLYDASNYHEKHIELLSKHFFITKINQNEQEKLKIILRSQKFEVIIAGLGFRFDERSLYYQDCCKYLCSPTTGHTHLDTDWIKSQKIQIISLKNEKRLLRYIKSTAEHTWWMIMSLYRNLNKLNLYSDNVNWRNNQYGIRDLHTRTIGIIGYGRIGKMISEYAKAFGLNILINDKIYPKNISKSLKKLPLKALLSKSDIITVNVDYNPTTDLLLNQKNSMFIKQGAIVVNTSRGEIVDIQALIKLLKSSKISGLGVDVLRGDAQWNKIPVSQRHLLKLCKKYNFILTRHVAGMGDLSVINTRSFIINKILESKIK